MNDKATDVGFWRELLLFTNEPGAWWLLTVAGLIYILYRHGKEIAAFVKEWGNSRTAQRDATLALVHAQVKEADARALTAEAEAETAKNARMTSMDQEIARLQIKVDVVERQRESAISSERDCLRNIAMIQGELNAISRLFAETRQELNDKGTALNVALLELKLERDKARENER